MTWSVLDCLTICLSKSNYKWKQIELNQIKKKTNLFFVKNIRDDGGCVGVVSWRSSDTIGIIGGMSESVDDKRGSASDMNGSVSGMSGSTDGMSESVDDKRGSAGDMSISVSGMSGSAGDLSGSTGGISGSAGDMSGSTGGMSRSAGDISGSTGDVFSAWKMDLVFRSRLFIFYSSFLCINALC